MARSSNHYTTSSTPARSDRVRERGQVAAPAIAAFLVLYNLITSAPPAAAAAPNPASNVTAVAASPTSLKLTWTLNGGGESGIKVLRYFNDSSSFRQVAFMSPGTTSFTDTGLTPSTVYTYYIIPLSNAGEAWGPASKAVGATPAATPPQPTSDVKAVALSPTSVRITWVNNGGDVQGTKILRYFNDTRSFRQIAFMKPGDTSYTDTGLTPNTPYAYYAVATDNAGYDAWGTTNQANVTTPSAATNPTPPQPTSNVRAVALSPTSIRITWVNNGGNVQGTKVLRYFNDTRSFRQVAFMSPSDAAYTDTGLTPDTEYAYYAIATDNAGYDAWGSTNKAVAATPKAAQEPVTRTGWYYPLNRAILSNANWLYSDQQYEAGKTHLGADLATSEGTPVYAIGAGRVIAIQSGAQGWGTGNYALAILHHASSGDFVAIYGHIRTSLKTGDSIPAGSRVQIGTVGPYPEGSHLHFGIHPGPGIPAANTTDPAKSYGWGRMSSSVDKSKFTNGFTAPIDWIYNSTPSR